MDTHCPPALDAEGKGDPRLRGSLGSWVPIGCPVSAAPDQPVSPHLVENALPYNLGAWTREGPPVAKHVSQIP